MSVASPPLLFIECIHSFQFIAIHFNSLQFIAIHVDTKISYIFTWFTVTSSIANILTRFPNYFACFKSFFHSTSSTSRRATSWHFLALAARTQRMLLHVDFDADADVDVDVDDGIIVNHTSRWPNQPNPFGFYGIYHIWFSGALHYDYSMQFSSNIYNIDIFRFFPQQTHSNTQTHTHTQRPDT